MAVAVIVLIVGFVLLVKGADFFVDGAAAFAKKLRVPGFIIGMTVVAMGPSAPECAVSITASLRGSNGMAISNVIGSNVFNLLVVCGVCALFMPLAIEKKTLKREFPFSVFAAVLLLALGAVDMTVGHVDGVIMLGIFVVFLVWMVMSARKAMQNGEEPESEEIRELSGLRCVLYMAGGVAAIVVGGQLVVNSAETIALGFGMSETLVGLTICSIGTSLPELVTSVVASRKNQACMALVNVICSNIFNILLVGGLASAISPIAVTTNNLIDLIFLVAISVYIMLLVWKRQELRRGGGISILAIYAVYMVYICVRDTGVLFIS
ncbi:MAG: calcium/sodium antiporter [Lachnospiraceae bacterium]|nr:calcium/sodium antiporter [Lachnospiraceae bacterium]